MNCSFGSHSGDRFADRSGNRSEDHSGRFDSEIESADTADTALDALGRLCTHRDPVTDQPCRNRRVPGEEYCTGCLWQRENERGDFDAWMRRVTKYLEHQVGLDPDDLPDCPYADWHRAGMPPAIAARQAVRRAEGRDE